MLPAKRGFLEDQGKPGLEPTKPTGLRVEGRIDRAKVEVDRVPTANRVEEAHQVVTNVQFDAFKGIPTHTNGAFKAWGQLVQRAGSF